MYTANTMASAIEALGMSLPNSSAQNAISPAKMDDCRRAGACVIEMLRQGIRPLDILTKKAFENAITVVIALSGSTNAVLHLLAIAHAAKVKLSLDDFTRVGKHVPVLADLKPSGKHLMSELVAIGGIRPLMKTPVSYTHLGYDGRAAARPYRLIWKNLIGIFDAATVRLRLCDRHGLAGNQGVHGFADIIARGARVVHRIRFVINRAGDQERDENDGPVGARVVGRVQDAPWAIGKRQVAAVGSACEVILQ